MEKEYGEVIHWEEVLELQTICPHCNNDNTTSEYIDEKFGTVECYQCEEEYHWEIDNETLANKK